MCVVNSELAGGMHSSSACCHVLYCLSQFVLPDTGANVFLWAYGGHGVTL